MYQCKWLFGIMDKRYHKRHLLALLISAVTSVMLLINPALTSKLVDQVIVAQNPEPLLGLLMAMLGFKVLRECLRYYMVVSLETTSQNTLFNLRQRLFEKLQYQDMHFFGRHRTGDLMTRLTADMDWCRHFLSFMDYQVVDCVFMFVSTLIYFFIVSWKLTLALFLVTPLLMLITKLYSSRVRPKFMDMRERLSEMNTAAQENIAGTRVVKAFAREDYERERFDARSSAFRDANLDINKMWLSFYPFIELLANLMTLITLFLGGYFIIQGELTPGELTIFTSLSWALSNPMRNLGNLINDLQRFTTSADKVMEVYFSKPVIQDKPAVKERSEVRGDVTFEHVGLSFGKVPVLKDVSFHVRPGQTLAIMGPTGSGKTTLIQLLSRFYDASGGSVLVDGVNVKDWKLDQLRRAIGTATQDVFLFSDTVEGNVAFGNQALTPDEVKTFARFADADGFVEKMPEGYDTIVGERGVGLSGGQRQRIALARALAMRPAILVMDDTTSAVDMETERYIQEQLRNLPYACTKIVIAQRISSVRDADLILVLKDGEIVQRGTHEELVRQPGYYYETYALQNDLPADAPVLEGGIC